MSARRVPIRYLPPVDTASVAHRLQEPLTGGFEQEPIVFDIKGGRPPLSRRSAPIAEVRPRTHAHTRGLATFEKSEPFPDGGRRPRADWRVA